MGGNSALTTSVIVALAAVVVALGAWALWLRLRSMRLGQELAEAHDLFWRIRLDHQVEQLRAGDEPDDYIDPEALNPVTRGYVREAFHAVSAVQRSLKGDLNLPP